MIPDRMRRGKAPRDVMKYRVHKGDWRGWKETGYVPPEYDIPHDERCDSIIEELKLVSREEWMRAAREWGRSGVPGCNPVYQLQCKIRDRPLTFAPQIIGMFVTPAGKFLERLVGWTSPKGWGLYHRIQNKGWMRKKAVDIQPYLVADPIMDRLDYAIENYGLEDRRTLKFSRQIIRFCLVDLEYD